MGRVMIQLKHPKITFVFFMFCLISFQTKGNAVEKVTGIGGFFFKSEDPKSLAKWYFDHLGIDLVPPDYDTAPWQQAAEPTVFTPFPKDTPMIPGQKTWMINFRVANLDAMIKQLLAAGIKVELDPETYPNGRFASLEDPEGNGIQLWEPK